MFAKGEGPEAAANPVEAGCSDDSLEADLKTDGALAELPRAPKGDCSEPAKDAKPDEANADDEVTWVDLAAFSVLESPEAGDCEAARDAKGETADVFKNALGREGWEIVC